MAKKENKSKTQKIAQALKSTGFILEMESANLLKNLGFNVKVNQYFLDLDENKKREIDIIATKEINKIEICLVIECKQSLINDWVFVCSDSDPDLYYNYVKHLPPAKNFHNNQLFDHLHPLDEKIPIAQNYIVLIKGERKTQDSQIRECLYKLPKATVEVVKKTQENKKTIFYSLGLFSGQLFAVRYKNRLNVQEKWLIQYPAELESEKYTSDDIKIKGKDFLIDFVAYKSLRKYIAMIEKETKKISTRKWRT